MIERIIIAMAFIILIVFNVICFFLYDQEYKNKTRDREEATEEEWSNMSSKK